MKALIILNIGLTTKENNRLDIHRALGAVAACGVSITSSAVVSGEWEGKPEPCLFVQGFVADPFAVGFRAQLYLASRILSQHVIAVYHNGRGELVGENPEGWTFDPALFHFHPEGKRPELQLSECQRVQRETAERLAKRTSESDKAGGAHVRIVSVANALRNEYESVNSVHAGAALERVAARLGIVLQ